VLGDALLVATTRRYHLVQLADALAHAAPHAELRTPTFVRAAELLLDQQLADGRLGIQHLLSEADGGGEAVVEEVAAVQATLAARLAAVARALGC
jgi:hypothetical protein